MRILPLEASQIQPLSIALSRSLFSASDSIKVDIQISLLLTIEISQMLSFLSKYPEEKSISRAFINSLFFILYSGDSVLLCDKNIIPIVVP